MNITSTTPNISSVRGSETWVENRCLQEDLLDSFADIPRSRLEHTYAVNILAMFSLAQKAVKIFEKQGSGNIINIGSIQAYMPTSGVLDYSSTKACPKSLLLHSQLQIQ